MADILKAYSTFTPASSRTDLAALFDKIINAPPFTFSQTTRVELIQLIIHDLKNVGSKGKLASKDAAHALLSVKTLGKDPAGSRYLSSSANLSALLGFALTFKEKDEPEATSEALRSIANAMLLVEEARSTFISKDVNGGETCILMLEKTTSPDYIFILSRILFLATASGPSYIETMVDGKFHGRTVIDILGSKLDLMTVAIQSGTPIAREAATDVLKFLFNILMHYPKMTESEPQNSDSSSGDKVIGDFWSPKLDAALPPLLRIFRDLPTSPSSPIVPPLTHVIHSLIAIPISTSLKSIWLGQPGSTPSRSSTNSSPKGKAPQLADSHPGSRSDSPTRMDKSPTSSKSSTIDRALSALAAAGRSLSRTSSPTVVVDIDVLQRAYDLLDQGFMQYFPGNVDVDAPEVRQRHKTDSNMDTPDDVLSPLIVLISRLCIADESSRLRLRQWVIPDDLDRLSPLDSRSDMLGRCLRLLGSVYHPRLKDAVGEMLFAACGQDATVLSTLVGYGNVAGFLFNKGILNAPPPMTAGSAGSANIPVEDIDPITGLKNQPKPELPEMTEEEKAQEMEKLFVLFDRLERSGALPANQNPVRKAMQKSMGGS
ncbi:hypothetical protein HYPSUDRAFT_258523 [Hypholoma sublateritium FD-334 SS-4]|uniref:Uncharacterized protein n=1 Tax=Hypholoma sublateritium (strain FD-334 SS-4) TaxID=945553 RepID=A0A0D2PPJ9_HYPSF|nr:hypothetical protein HYPSUDRAFT_258523 [Hypholoma sublateritium FD-334 SS-4]